MRLVLLLVLLGCLSQVSAFGVNYNINVQSATNNQQTYADNHEDSEAQSEATSSAESEEDLSEDETIDLDNDDDDGSSEESDDDDDSSEESEDESTSSAETSSGSEEDGGDSEEENSSESGQKRWDYSAYVPKDVLGDKANQLILMLFSNDKVKAVTKFLDTVHQKLQSLTAMDDTEGSKANLERQQFIQTFLGNYAKTLSGSTTIPGINISELKLCIKKVELLIQLIKDTKQKIEDEPSGSKKIPEILLTSFKTGVAILLHNTLCPATTTGQDERQKKTPVLSRLKKTMNQKKSKSQQSAIGQLISGASKLLSAGPKSQQVKQDLSKLFNSFGQNKKESNKVFSDGKLTGSIDFSTFKFGKK